MNRKKEPLYRKVNTKARNVHHGFGSDARHDRNTKAGLNKSMKQGIQRGLDYTPLYRFLLSKIGEDWGEVYGEAIARLDTPDAVYHLVRNESERSYIYCGEASIYNTLFVDENNKLQKRNPDLTNEMFWPNCHCCTHTFNGKVLVNKYNSLMVGKNIKIDEKETT